MHKILMLTVEKKFSEINYSVKTADFDMFHSVKMTYFDLFHSVKTTDLDLFYLVKTTGFDIFHSVKKESVFHKFTNKNIMNWFTTNAI